MITIFQPKNKLGELSVRQSVIARGADLHAAATSTIVKAGMFFESANEANGMDTMAAKCQDLMRDIVEANALSLTFESAGDMERAGIDARRPDWQGSRSASAEAAAFASWASAAGKKLVGESAARIDGMSLSFEGAAVIQSIVPDSIAFSDIDSGLRLTTEAYDATEMALMHEYSMSFNYDGSYGSLFTETLYPTIAINPNHVGLEVMSKVRVVQDYATHSTSGAVTKWNRRNILFAFKDHTLLKKNSTTMVPVYRPTNANSFVDSAVLAPVDVVIDGETVSTSSLRIGAAVQYLGLCQTDAQLTQGSADTTDSIEPAVALRYLDFKFGDDIVRINTLDMATSVFTETPQAQDREMMVNFRVDNVALTAETTNVAGAALANVEMAKIASEKLVVLLNLEAHGRINLRSGEVKVSFAKATLGGIRKVQSDGTQIDVLGTHAALAAVITAGADALGYDIQAYSTNSNFRRFGDIVDTVTFKRVYTVPRRSPIVARRPIAADAAVDRDDLQALVATIKARLNNEAVTMLLSQFDTLYSRYQGYKRDPEDLIPEQFGVGAFYFRPYAVRLQELDLSNIVDSLKSADRMEDLQAALLTVIRQYVYEMYNMAEMDPGLEMLFGAGAKRPEVIVATDQLISKYLMQGGETRTLGPGFDFRVVETIDDRFTNRIFLTFGCFNQSTNQELNPAHWGNMLWVPEVTQSITPRSSNGQVSRETFVTPRYLFVNNLPVASMITLKANTIKELTQTKVTLWTDEH